MAKLFNRLDPEWTPTALGQILRKCTEGDVAVMCLGEHRYRFVYTIDNSRPLPKWRWRPENGTGGHSCSHLATRLVAGEAHRLELYREWEDQTPPAGKGDGLVPPFKDGAPDGPPLHIPIGTLVRSFDFDATTRELARYGHPNLRSYVDGVLVGILDPGERWPCAGPGLPYDSDPAPHRSYVIRMTKRIGGGSDITESQVARTWYIFPPVNGLHCTFGGHCAGVYPQDSAPHETPVQPDAATVLAAYRDAAMSLVVAYENGEAAGGSMEWSDVDLAHESALSALQQEAR